MSDDYDSSTPADGSSSERGFGYIPHPENDRNDPPFEPGDEALDRTFGWGVPPAGDSGLQQLPTPILNQGGLSSCVANVIAQQARHLWWRGGNPNPLIPSRLWIYFYGRSYSGIESYDAGSHPRAVYMALAEGFCEEKYWPYDPRKVLEVPGFNAHRHSFPRTAEGIATLRQQGTPIDDLNYYRISSERRGKVSAAINNGHTVGIGMSVDAAFVNYKGGIWRFRGPEIGLHYVLAGKYNEQGVWCLSSWGAGYGDAGGIWVDWETIESSVCLDFFVLTSIPRLLQAA